MQLQNKFSSGFLVDMLRVKKKVKIKGKKMNRKIDKLPKKQNPI